MRVIRVELTIALTARDASVSLASEEIRAALCARLAEIEPQLAEMIRQRAAAYFPATFTVFVRLRPDKQKPELVSEIWIVDPSVSWPQGLLTRRAWSLFVPVLAHVVCEAIEHQVGEIKPVVRDNLTKVSAFASARTWRDPVVLTAAVMLATTAFWLWAVPAIWPPAPGAQPAAARVEGTVRPGPVGSSAVLSPPGESVLRPAQIEPGAGAPLAKPGLGGQPAGDRRPATETPLRR